MAADLIDQASEPDDVLSDTLIGSVTPQSSSSRWWVLTVFCLAAITQACTWNIFSPIADSVRCLVLVCCCCLVAAAAAAWWLLLLLPGASLLLCCCCCCCCYLSATLLLLAGAAAASTLCCFSLTHGALPRCC